MADEIVSVAGGAFDGHKDIAICDGTRIDTDISGIV
jgi:hypothetical protein